MPEKRQSPAQARRDDPPAKAKGPLKGAPVDGATADNPAHPKGEPGRDPPRPGAPSGSVRSGPAAPG